MTYCLDLEAVVELNRIVTRDRGGVRDREGLDGALQRPMHTWGGADLYPTFVDKAAALLHALARTQYFHDGNKRTAWFSCVIYLRLADIHLQPADDEADEFVLSVAKGQLDQEEVAVWILEQLDE